MPSLLDALKYRLSPEASYLEAMHGVVDTEQSELERLGGQAVQESRDEMRQRRKELLNTMGEYGGSSTDFYNLLSRVEESQKLQESGISQNIAERRYAAQQMKRQLAALIPIKAAQEMPGRPMEWLERLGITAPGTEQAGMNLLAGQLGGMAGGNAGTSGQGLPVPAVSSQATQPVMPGDVYGQQEAGARYAQRYGEPWQYPGGYGWESRYDRYAGRR